MSAWYSTSTITSGTGTDLVSSVPCRGSDGGGGVLLQVLRVFVSYLPALHTAECTSVIPIDDTHRSSRIVLCKGHKYKYKYIHKCKYLNDTVYCIVHGSIEALKQGLAIFATATSHKIQYCLLVLSLSHGSFTFEVPLRIDPSLSWVLLPQLHNILHLVLSPNAQQADPGSIQLKRTNALVGYIGTLAACQGHTTL